MRKCWFVLALLFLLPTSASAQLTQSYSSWKVVGWDDSLFAAQRPYLPHYTMSGVKVLVDQSCGQIYYNADEEPSPPFQIGVMGSLSRKIYQINYLGYPQYGQMTYGQRDINSIRLGTFITLPEFVGGEMVMKLHWQPIALTTTNMIEGPYPLPYCLTKIDAGDPGYPVFGPAWDDFDSWYHFGPNDPYAPYNPLPL